MTGILFLAKLKVIDKNTEKHINMYLNNWIRVPGILYCLTLIHIGYLNGLLEVSRSILIITQFFAFVNAVYFAQRVTFNFGTKYKLSSNLTN